MAFPAPPPQSYGYCNSYFVENHDDDDQHHHHNNNGIYARAAAERERQRALAKTRQSEYANELSRLTADEYKHDILKHMETMETQTMPDVNSIDIQTEVEWYMRPYLLDFLLEAHHAFQLLPDTLFLAINLLDRYCSKRVVYKRHYQLVGCSALLIAAKYGDRKDYVPTINELKSMCCSLYDEDMFSQMEWHVLQTVNWIIGHPTVASFQEYVAAFAPSDPELKHMALYISEAAMYHREFIPVLPSIMAKSSLALAKCILNRPQACGADWASRFDANVVIELSNKLAFPSKALYGKYASPHLSSVSTTVETFIHNQALLVAEAEAEGIVSDNVATPQPVETKVHTDTYLNPQTPQKNGYYMVPLGVLTPPITPDKDLGVGQTFTFGNANLPQFDPTVASPFPEIDEDQYLAYIDAPPQVLP